MAKSARSKKKNGNKKGLPRLVLVAAVLLVALGAFGALAMYLGGSGPKVPSPRTAGGKLVVLEFSDYG